MNHPELQDLVAKGQANLEQTEELAQEQQTLSETQADLARAQAQRQVSLDAAAAAAATARAVLTDAQEALAEAQGGGDALAHAKAQLIVQLGTRRTIPSSLDMMAARMGLHTTRPFGPFFG